MSDIPILRLDQQLSDKIRAYGAETYPHECCGALLGRDLEAATTRSSDATSLASREVTALFPLVNRRDDSPRNRFSVTSEDVRDAEKAAREKGIDVVGWYHSHPDHPAQPSQYDRDHAWPWYSYIIVSVANGRPATMTSWRLTDDRTQFTPENLEIADKGGAAQSAS
jgi:proteasome lid subunit RPN8/RPN11